MDIVLIITGGYVALKLYKFSDNLKKTHFFCLAVASGIFVLIHAIIGIGDVVNNTEFNRISSTVFEWGHLIILTLVLSSLAIFIRNSKPIFAQFPKFYATFPVLIIISYFFVKDTYALKEWLISIYQGGALFISLLIYSALAYRNKGYFPVLGGIFIILLSYILYWFIPGVELYSWTWKITLAGGMVLSVFGYQNLRQQVGDGSIKTNPLI